MELGMIGLGRMGANMAHRLLAGGHRVVAYDAVKEARDAAVRLGAIEADSVQALVQKLAPPRAVWLMVPAGSPTETTIGTLAGILASGDIVIDGGNSNYKDSMRRAAALSQRGIALLDVGTSGGIWGLKEGYCLMVGGSIDAFRRMEPVFRTLAPAHDKGYSYVGPSGAGYFVKMVHNGIEYGLMEAYAEGFELLETKRDFNLDLARIAEVWRHGSVVRSWLLDLTARALQQDPALESLEAYVEDSGEGRWTVQEAIDLAVPVPAIAQALEVRFRSRQERPFGSRLLAALRQQFGGHPVKKANK